VDANSTLNTVRDWPMKDQLELVFGLWDQIVDSGWHPSPEPELLEELHRRPRGSDSLSHPCVNLRQGRRLGYNRLPPLTQDFLQAPLARRFWNHDRRHSLLIVATILPLAPARQSV
jgi:hypothetical protein